MSHCRKSMWHGVCAGVASKRNSGGVRDVRYKVMSMLGDFSLGSLQKHLLQKSTCHTASPCQRVTPSVDLSPRLKSPGKIHLSLFHPLFLTFSNSFLFFFPIVTNQSRYSTAQIYIIIMFLSIALCSCNLSHYCYASMFFQHLMKNVNYIQNLKGLCSNTSMLMPKSLKFYISYIYQFIHLY